MNVQYLNRTKSPGQDEPLSISLLLKLRFSSVASKQVTLLKFGQEASCRYTAFQIRRILGRGAKKCCPKIPSRLLPSGTRGQGHDLGRQIWNQSTQLIRTA